MTKNKADTRDRDFLIALAKGFNITQSRVTENECQEMGGNIINNMCVLNGE